MKDFKIVYSDQAFPHDFCVKNSLFLAGPTSRTEKTQWRLDAIELLRKYNEVFSFVAVPERTSWKDGFKYEEQILWEKQGLETSSTIIFWVPRDMQTMPGLTTNVEFGWWMHEAPERVLYGRPRNAPSTKYLDLLYRRQTHCAPFDDLESMIHYVGALFGNVH